MGNRDSSPSAPLLPLTPPASPPSRQSFEMVDAHTLFIPKGYRQQQKTLQQAIPTIFRPDTNVKLKMASARPIRKADTEHLYNSLDNEEGGDLEAQAIAAMRHNSMALVRVDKVLFVYYAVMLILLVDALIVLPVVLYNLKGKDGNGDN